MDKKPKAKAKPKFKVVKKDEKKKFTTAKPKKEEKEKKKMDMFKFNKSLDSAFSKALKNDKKGKLKELGKMLEPFGEKPKAMAKPKFKVVKKDEKKKFTKIKKTAGEKLTGLKAEEMKKMKPEELFSKLPKELSDKIGYGALKYHELPSYSELEKLSPPKLLEKYIQISEEPELRLQFKDMKFKKKTTAILKSIGKDFGRLPQLQDYEKSGQFVHKINQKFNDLELFNVLNKKFGEGYGKRVRRELLERLEDKGKRPRKQFIKALQANIKLRKEWEEFEELQKAKYPAMEVVNKRIQKIIDSGKEKKIHFHRDGRHRERYIKTYNKFMEEYLSYASPSVKKIAEKNSFFLEY